MRGSALSGYGVPPHPTLSPSGRGFHAARTRTLEAKDFRVLRFSNREVMTSIDVVLDTILAALADVAPHPRPLPARGRGARVVTRAATRVAGAGWIGLRTASLVSRRQLVRLSARAGRERAGARADRAGVVAAADRCSRSWPRRGRCSARRIARAPGAGSPRRGRPGSRSWRCRASRSASTAGTRPGWPPSSGRPARARPAWVSAQL